MKSCNGCGKEFRDYDFVEVYRERQLWECRCPYCQGVLQIREFETPKDIFTGQGYSLDIGSKAMLLKHIKRLCKQLGKNYKGFSKMPKKQLYMIFQKLSTTSPLTKN